jgi:hypothetical protein
MKYKIEFDGKTDICTRDQIENAEYDITSSKTAKTQILILFNDLIWFRANDIQNFNEPRTFIDMTWMGFKLRIECIPEEIL